MKAKSVVLVLICSFSGLTAAPLYNNDPASMREVRDKLDYLRHEVANHQSEIHILQEKVANQELIIDALRQQVTDNSKASKDYVKGNANTVEARLLGQETTTKGLVADIKQLQKHANDSSETFVQLKHQLTQMEKLLDTQQANLEHVQSALKIIMEALAIKDTHAPTEASPATGFYIVQSGDTLEKIARKNKTTIKALKEANNLNKDIITVGQKLKIPEHP